MNMPMYNLALESYEKLRYYIDGFFDSDGMRHFTDEVVLFVCSHKNDKAIVISSRAATARFAAGKPLDLSLVSEDASCFEVESLPRDGFSLGALVLPLDEAGQVSTTTYELAALFTPSALPRNAFFAVRNAALFFGCGFHCEGSESAPTLLEGCDSSFGAVLLILCAMLRRLSKKRGFNFRFESASGIWAFSVSADLHLQSGEELEDTSEFICLKEIFESRELPFLYRFASRDGAPRLILRLSPLHVSVESLLRAALPEGITDIDALTYEERIPDVAGEY